MKISTLDLTNSRYLNVDFKSDLKLAKNSIHVFDSFHNSFFETYWFQHTNLREAQFRITIQGKGSIQLIRNSENKESFVFKQLFESMDSQELILRFDITDAPASRIYLRMECDTDCILQNNIIIETEQAPERTTSIALIMCTFNKQPYIQKNLTDLLSWKDFLESNSEILIVDNASNLELSPHPKLQYFAQGNFGGAGGFTRGLLEARSQGKFTHYLFMDDDIELDPDMITRTSAVATFSNDEKAICGGMLSLKDKNVLWELGANFYNRKFTGAAELCYHEENLSKDLLSSIAKPFTFDYGGWWYFCISDKSVEKAGYPLPCFIRGDDVEYGVRLNSLGIRNLPFPGIAVWHEPLTAKTAPWLHYFRFRNYFIIGLLYRTKRSAYKQTVKFLLSIAGNILIFDYNLANVQLEALSGVIDGSGDIGKLSNPDHKNLITKKLNPYSYKDVSDTGESVYKTGRGNFLQMLFKVITMNGHLIPFSTGCKTVDMRSWKKRVLFAAEMPSRVLVYNNENKTSVTFEKSFRQFVTLSFKWMIAAICILVRLPSLRGEYKNQRSMYSKPLKWREFLAIN